MTTVDELITKYTSIDAYTAPVERMIAATERFATRIAYAVGVTSVLSGTGGLVAAGVSALKASADFEQTAVTLEVLSGSAEKAAAKLDFMRRLAIPSTFTFKQLSEAGVEVEAFGLRLERILPLIAKLGAAFKPDAAGLMEMVNIFGRIAQGQFPEIRALSRFGLNKQQFAQQGIQFSKSGELLSNARDTLNALDRIINDKYGQILERVQNTTNSKLTSLQDTWEQVMRKIGDILARYVLPLVEKLSAALDRLGQGNRLQKIADSIGHAFKVAARWIEFAGAVLAGVITASIMTNMARMVVLVLQLAQGFSLAAIAAAALQVITGNWVKLAIGAVAALTGLFVGLAIFKKFRDEQKKMEAGLRGLFASENGARPEVPSDTGPFSNTGNDDALASIAKNTERTAHNTTKMLDFRKFALGGGPLGAIGVTPVELFGGRGSARERYRPQSVRLEVGGGDIERAMAKVVNQVILDLQRKGILH
jgi:hypothetical protein